MAKVFESIAKQEKVFSNENIKPTTSNEVNKINTQTKQSFKRKAQTDETIECFRCGYTGHRASSDKCPAIGKTCNKCGGRNHFGSKCKSKRRVQMKAVNNNVKSETKPETNTNEELQQTKRLKLNDNIVKFITDNSDDYVFCIHSGDPGNTIECKIGQVETKAIVDSGSRYNLMDHKLWHELKTKKIVVSNQQKDTDKVFKAYGGHPLPVVGMFEAQIEVNGKQTNAEFYVIKEKGQFLIGWETATILGILKIGHTINTIDEEKDSKMQPMGKMKDIIVDIPLRENAVPVAQSYRRVPVPLEAAVDKKIDQLLQQGIIEPVKGPSKWISPVVAIPKDDGQDLRICIDMRRANEAVERENYPLPTMENFLPYLAKAKRFSKLDIKQAFHQV